MPETPPSPAERPPRRLRRTMRKVVGLALVGSAIVSGRATDPVGAQAGPPPADACAGVDTTVSLVGSTSAKEAVSHWALAICRDAKVVADYTDLGSKGGRDAVTPATAAVVGLTALPFTAGEQAALQAQKRQVVMVPVLAGSIACTYWNTNPFDPAQAGKRYPNLRLSRRTLADIFSGAPRDGSNFSPDLAADNAENPEYVVGPPFLAVEPWLRSGASAVTYQLTDWIAHDERAAADFVKAGFTGATLPFEEAPIPSSPTPQLLNDYSTMISRMTGAPQALGIGCMDSATASTDIRPETPQLDTLNVAWLDNPTGRFVAPTADAVSRSVAAMSAHPDGTFSPDWSLDDQAAYPLPLVVYAAVPTCGIDATTRDAIDAVLEYAVGPGQSNLPPGNVPMSGPVAVTATQQLGRWRDLTTTVQPCGAPPTTTTTSGGPSAAPPPGDFGPSGPGSSGFGTSGFEGGSGGGGVFSDPSVVASPAGAAGSGGAAADPVGATTGGSGDGGGSGPLGQLPRILAVATGSAALSPVVVLCLGVALLLGGPALQVLGGRRRAGSLPWSVTAWFRNLRP